MRISKISMTKESPYLMITNSTSRMVSSKVATTAISSSTVGIKRSKLIMKYLMVSNTCFTFTLKFFDKVYLMEVL